MVLLISQPTNNQTPDATLGGLAVTSPTNTGHASTGTSASGGASQNKSCRWFAFQSVLGQKTAITLKIDHTSSGTLVGAGASNAFTLSYSLNGGGSWTNAVVRTNFTSAQGPTTFSVALSVGQDISQVQVRTFYQTSTASELETASVTAAISNIKLEVAILETPPSVVIM